MRLKKPEVKLYGKNMSYAKWSFYVVESIRRSVWVCQCPVFCTFYPVIPGVRAAPPHGPLGCLATWFIALPVIIVVNCS